MSPPYITIVLGHFAWETWVSVGLPSAALCILRHDDFVPVRDDPRKNMEGFFGEKL